jgi:cyclic pyranopterin monophosphate synthase
VSDLTHLDSTGAARMVDVSGKDVTDRSATATGLILMSPEALTALRAGTLRKGDALAVARVAGIMAAKRTAELIPLCHPLGLTGVEVDLTFESEPPGVRATAAVRTVERTGVEMEALTAVLVALATIYDMAKAVDRKMSITEVRVLGKKGGRSG